MDFVQMNVKQTKEGFELKPGFVVGRTKDLMVRGKSFYAVWDEEEGIWSTDEYDTQRLVDKELYEYADRNPERDYIIHSMRSFDSNIWVKFKQYLREVGDNYHQLDSDLTWSNTEVKKSDYVSRRLPYALEPGDISAWDELVGTLYSVEERRKIEWAIGSIVAGDSKKIQKFMVLYGPAGTGKSTILNIVSDLFTGYTTSFEAKALGSNNGSFATEVFKNNPLVAIQHDGDLSRIEDNTRLNSIISHEEMTMNEKFKASYTSRINAFLFMGTNQPVKISDAKSGIIRRLIDVHPTGVKLPANHYNVLMQQISFELGAIAYHCLQVYREMGKNYYNGYRPLEMMLQTDVFFNFVEAYYDVFKQQDYVSLSQAYKMYKEFCGETGIERPLPQYKVREELRNYFDEFHDRHKIDGNTMRSVYVGFNANQFKAPAKEANAYSLVMEEETSLLDEILADAPAQYATESGTPEKKWADVETTLKDLDTTKLHYVKVPENHIVIDFDLKDENGNKSLERNLEAASAWPATYGEVSRSGAGVHLHYTYCGDALERLSSVYSDGIEVKRYTGGSSLRRIVRRTNGIEIASISSGLPLKEPKVLTDEKMKSEQSIRRLIGQNLRKEIHPGTKPSVDFIKKILDDAYESGMEYDVTDMKPGIIAFANNSTNQNMESLKQVSKMKFKSEDSTEEIVEGNPDEPLVFFDVETYPNLFVICWKYAGSDTVVKMVNPKAEMVEELMRKKLVGFNCRRYDNHMLYGASMGYDNEQLYKLSQKLINNEQSAKFGGAYNLSYTDIYDFSSKKQGLKKFQIELGIKHQEMDIPWDEPVPDDKIDKVVEYCVNDVEATEAVFNARSADFTARQILAELSGLTVNHTTQNHTAKIIFGNDKAPQRSFVYTDLSKEFEGYEFDAGKSYYRDEVVGEGGYVYAEPGIYEDVALLDVSSMHPTSAVLLNLFGKEYTNNFNDLLKARLAIKRGDYSQARKMLDGKLEPYLKEESDAKDLSFALKIVINIVYGLTSAKFDNPFRDQRNKDNIVAKRGALFMIDLKHFVQEQGFTVAHIKTDSIKIPNATPEIIEKVMEFGKKYGYDFEHEETYQKMALVNESVYIASISNGRDKQPTWTATGAQFAHPYVFKTLFSKEELKLEDFFETKQVSKGAMYLDFEENKAMALRHNTLHHVGRTGQFVAVDPESGQGGLLVRKDGEKTYAVTGTKSYLWIEAALAQDWIMEDELQIDMDYYEHLADEAVKTIEKFGSFDEFIAPF